MPRLSDVPTILRSAAWVIAARMVIARTGFAGAVRRYDLQAADAAAPAAHPLSPAAARAAIVAQRVVRLRLLGATCLPRSIAIARVVASYGTPTDIVLGVTKPQHFEAHAWVEAGGQRFDASDYPDNAWEPAGRFTLTP
ncbi:MAG: lasso peptide biosynthesis B2 protein [Mycobacteriales bacterium]